MGRLTGPYAPKVLKVLRFDSGFVAEGCGGGFAAIYRAIGEKVQKSHKIQRIQRVQRVLPAYSGRVQRVVASPCRAMSMKSALRDFVLCHKWYMKECWSPLPLEGGVAVGDGG